MSIACVKKASNYSYNDYPSTYLTFKLIFFSSNVARMVQEAFDKRNYLGFIWRPRFRFGLNFK